MSHGLSVNTTHFTPMTAYGMERTVSPAAHVHVVHNLIVETTDPTSDYIEPRICLYDLLRYSNLAVELVELYVQ